MTCTVVIGANWGDEGKGLVVDHLATSDTLVVRHNGGSQAGHTVITPEGRRHEFHHIGAGTFRGAATLLSRHFIVNPMMFLPEWRRLIALGAVPRIMVDYRCEVSTPFDMLLNRAVELKRGSNRHGSCGVGINETVTRSNAGYGITVRDCLRKNTCIFKIAREYMPARATALGIKVPACDYDLYVERWWSDVEEMLNHIEVGEDTARLRHWRGEILFEGAQGLRLDEHSEDFPHVTRSRTGLTNVVQLTREAALPDPTPYYVTRTYVTRHGAGPLPGEVAQHPYGWAGPETNVTNPHQGALRYAPLDVPRMEATILADLKNAGVDVSTARLAVTCLDQGGAVDSRIPIALHSYGSTHLDVTSIPCYHDGEVVK